MLRPPEGLLGRVGDRDDVAAAVAVAAHGADRLADLKVGVRLDDALGGENRVELADARRRGPWAAGPAAR